MRRGSARLLVGLALACMTVVLSGSAASAHAVLLGTDPSIGGVISGAPTALRLHFSGPVENRFSAVQVTEPDGQQVHTGPPQRAAGATGSRAGARFDSLFSAALPLSWVVLAATGAAGILLEAAAASGGSLSSSLQPAVLTRVLDTTYGRLWLAQMVLTLALALPVAALSRRTGAARSRPRQWRALRALGALAVGGLAAVVVAN